MAILNDILSSFFVCNSKVSPSFYEVFILALLVLHLQVFSGVSQLLPLFVPHESEDFHSTRFMVKREKKQKNFNFAPAKGFFLKFCFNCNKTLGELS